MEVTSGSKAEINDCDEKGGFNFDLYARNGYLSQTLGNGDLSKLPKAWKTGTTIVGMIYKDGVVLGADTRATGDTVVVEKNCQKIHYLAPNIYCCGAGTAADTEKTTDLIASNLELLRLSSGTQSRVVTAMTLLKRMLHKYQGNIGAALILGGWDVTGAHLYSIFPHGSTQYLPYVTMGSGSLAAMSVFETKYTEDMDEESAIQLTREAVRAGIFNDLGSGSNVDITVLRNGGDTAVFRTFENAAGNAKDYKNKYVRPPKLNMPLGATFVVEESFKPFKKPTTDLIPSVTAAAEMEVE